MLVQSDREPEHAVPAKPAAVDVTIVSQDLGAVGGMEHQLAELVTGLRGLGHEITVIARTCELPADAGVTFRRVRGPSRPFIFAYPWFMAVATLMVRRYKRGIVQSTGAIVLNRVDVIAVHYCHQVGPANPSRSTSLFRLHNALVGKMVRLGEHWCFHRNRAATYACVSDGVAEEVRSHYPQLVDRVVTIHNGVDVTSFAPGTRRDEARAMRDSLGLAGDRLVAAFVGSEWERKGLEPLIRSLAMAPEWDLVVAGSGDRERYRDLADSIGVSKAVRWLGVSRDIQLVYELADALVSPSRYEAFSLVALEAAASGLPILATPVNGVRELISDGSNGFLISQDPSVIAERLRRLASDPELREQMGRAARESALSFRWETMVAKHHDLYARLASPSSG